MSLENAVITSIAAPAGADGFGRVRYDTPVEMPAGGAPCVAGGIEHRHTVMLGAVIKDASGVIYVRMSRLPAGFSVKLGQRLTVQPLHEGAPFGPPATWQVVHHRPWMKPGGLSTWEIFVREVPA